MNNDKPQAVLPISEEETIAQAISRFGYGKLILHLKQAWIKNLTQQGLKPEAATRVAEFVASYPVEPVESLPAVELAVRMEKLKGTLRLQPVYDPRLLETCAFCGYPTRFILPVPVCARCAAEAGEKSGPQENPFKPPKTQIACI